MSSVLEDSSISDKLVTGGASSGVEKVRFIYGQGMQKQWVEGIGLFLDFVGSRHGQSVKASLEAGELVVTEDDEGVLRKFDAEVEMKAYVSTLKHWEQELCLKTHRKAKINCVTALQSQVKPSEDL